MTHHHVPARPAWLVASVAVGVFVLVDLYGSGPSWRLVEATGAARGSWARVGAIALLHWLPMILAPLAASAALFGPSGALAALGLRSAPLPGLALAVVLTAPLAITYALTTPLRTDEAVSRDLVHYALLGGAAEEVLYRAFLFGLLFRFARWGFLPAALLGAVIFGAGHLSQGNTPAEAAGVFAITFVGGLWFAWLYAEWRDAWVPIGLHIAMNAWFNLFAVSETALLPWAGEVARAAVVIGSVLVTVRVARRRGGRVVRGRAWLRGGPVAIGAEAATSPP